MSAASQHVEVSTARFEFSHGKLPRGFGYWAFFIGDDPEPFFATGLYSVCRDDARRLAVARGATRVEVGP